MAEARLFPSTYFRRQSAVTTAKLPKRPTKSRAGPGVGLDRLAVPEATTRSRRLLDHHQAASTERGLCSSSRATKVKTPSVTFTSV